jgi:hypothetical protein
MLDLINTGIRRIVTLPEDAWHKLERMVLALERTAQSAESHIAKVADLTDAVTLLTQQLNELLTVLHPVAEAEREVAHDVERVTRFLHLGHHPDKAETVVNADNGAPPPDADR